MIKIPFIILVLFISNSFCSELEIEFLNAKTTTLGSELISQKDSINDDQLNSTVLWDKLEFKYDLNRFDGQTQQFEFRLSPTNIWKNESDENVFRHRKNLFSLKSLQLKNKLIEKRYLHLINKYEIQFKESWKDSLLKLQLSRYQYLLTQSTQVDFDPRELLNSQNKLLNLKNDSIEIIRRKESWNLKSKELGADLALSEKINQSTLNADELLTIEDIIKYIDQLSNSNTPINYETQLAIENLKVREELAKGEKIKSNAFLSYFKIGYELDIPKDRNDPISFADKQWFAGVGFEIPFGNNSYQDNLKRKMDVLEERTNSIEKQEENQSEWGELLTEVKINAEKLSQISKFRATLLEGGLAESLKIWASQNPALLFETQELLLDSQYESQILMLDIFKKYISLLAMQNILSDQSYHLLKALPK